MYKVLISVLGQDRPGIIARVAGEITARQGNIENVSQTLLQDIFGALVIASIPDSDDPESLKAALREACQDQHLFIHVDHYAAPAPRPIPDTQPYVVSASGPDRSGLIAAIAGRLSRHGLNISNLHAHLTDPGMRFANVMIFEVDVPRATVMDDLRAELAGLATELGLDINIQHRKIFEAVSHIDR